MRSITNIIDLINTAASEHAEAYLLTGQHHGMTNGKWPDFQSVGPTTNISPFASGYAIREHVFLVTYDYSRNQTNNIINYFSTIAPNKYYIKPSSWGMSLFFDPDSENIERRDPRANHTGNVDVPGSADTVVIKFVRNFRSSSQSYRNDVAIIPYLAADLHLMMAEAFIGLGRFREALVLWNEGLAYHANNPGGSLNMKVPAYSIFSGTRLPYRTPGSQEAYAHLGVRGRAYGYGTSGSALTPIKIGRAHV